MEKLSVITINLNNKEGLKKTIDSVIKQTCFSLLEFIVIDGESTDGSVDVIRENERYLKYWVSEKDGGIYDAMNKGIRMANGEFCLFLNSGDTFHSECSFGLSIPYLNKDIVYGNMIIDGKVATYPDRLTNGYFRYNTLPHQASFIRTALLKKRGYDTSYRVISDWIRFRELIMVGCSYRHIDVLVSDFEPGGISADYNKIKTERKRYLESIQ